MDDFKKTRATLLLRIRDTDNDAAWNEFVSIYGPLIRGFCLRRGLQESDAADVSQEVIRKVAGTVHSFEYEPERGSFRSWLFTVVRNQINLFIRKQKRQPSVWNDTAIIRRLEADSTFDLESEWDREYNEHVLNWAAGTVRREFKESTWRAFWRTAVEGVDAPRAAAELGLTVGAVYIARSRVLARMKAKIQTLTDEGPAL